MKETGSMSLRTKRRKENNCKPIANKEAGTFYSGFFVTNILMVLPYKILIFGDLYYDKFFAPDRLLLLKEHYDGQRRLKGWKV